MYLWIVTENHNVLRYGTFKAFEFGVGISKAGSQVLPVPIQDKILGLDGQ